MAGAGTLLSDIEEQPMPSQQDGDLVQKILADINGPPSGPPMPNHLPARANPGYNSGMNSPSPNGGPPQAMDSRTATAHVIGGDHPTPGDFARAMMGLQSGDVGAPYVSSESVATPTYTPPKRNFYSRMIEEAKVPFVVTFLFFLFSLPPVRILFAHYLPQFVKPTGEFQLVGLVIVSILVGLTFWVLQRVIVPLLSL